MMSSQCRQYKVPSKRIYRPSCLIHSLVPLTSDLSFCRFACVGPENQQIRVSRFALASVLMFSSSSKTRYIFCVEAYRVLCYVGLTAYCVGMLLCQAYRVLCRHVAMSGLPCVVLACCYVKLTACCVGMLLCQVYRVLCWHVAMSSLPRVVFLIKLYFTSLHQYIHTHLCTWNTQNIHAGVCLFSPKNIVL